MKKMKRLNISEHLLVRMNGALKVFYVVFLKKYPGKNMLTLRDKCLRNFGRALRGRDNPDVSVPPEEDDVFKPPGEVLPLHVLVNLLNYDDAVTEIINHSKEMVRIGRAIRILDIETYKSAEPPRLFCCYLFTHFPKSSEILAKILEVSFVVFVK